MRLISYTALLTLFFLLPSSAKSNPDAYISFTYRDARLEEVIKDLERRYDLAFSYSPSSTLLDFRISSRSGLVQVEEGLRLMFIGTPIEYRIIRGRIAIRYNRRLAEELLSQVEEPVSKPERNKPKKDPPVEIAEPAIEVTPEPAPRRNVPAPANPIPTEDAEEVPWISSPPVTNQSVRVQNRQKKRQLGQFSVFPDVSTNPGRARDYINTISFNAPAGISGGVVGAEVGVLFNGIAGDLEGMQLSGGMNVVSDQMTGVQIAALGNGAGIGSGVQIAGGFNYCRRTLQGTQIAALANIALNGAGSQYAVLVNVSEGDVKRQIGLLNRAQNVARNQFGLINISDTIAGRPIGLFNFVKKGYNTIEIGRTSLYPYSLSLRLGAHRLYNIFEFSGGRRELQLLTEEGTSQQLIWGLGYGFGWTNRAGNNARNRWHTEFVASHFNRGAAWMKRLNFVFSMRFTYDWRAGQNTHLFFGPVMNLHWSKLSDQELDGLFVSSYRVFQTRYDNVLFRGFLGFRFGARLGRH